MRKNEKITALYERLSRDDFGKDDDQQRESNSISNQKAMLKLLLRINKYPYTLPIIAFRLSESAI